MNDEELIKSLILLLCARMANDAGDAEFTTEDREIWYADTMSIVYEGAKRVGMKVGSLQ